MQSVRQDALEKCDLLEFRTCRVWHGNIPWLYSFLANLFEMMLFVFCQLVAMQVRWMKACTVMVP
jgi:hypothetical protein